MSCCIHASAIFPKIGSSESIHAVPWPFSVMFGLLRTRFSGAGTLPWKAGSCPTMPSCRYLFATISLALLEECNLWPAIVTAHRARIWRCKPHCSFIHERGSGPATPLPYSFWPRLQVRRAGPLNQERI